MDVMDIEPQKVIRVKLTYPPTIQSIEMIAERTERSVHQWLSNHQDAKCYTPLSQRDQPRSGQFYTQEFVVKLKEKVRGSFYNLFEFFEENKIGRSIIHEYEPTCDREILFIDFEDLFDTLLFERKLMTMKEKILNSLEVHFEIKVIMDHQKDGRAQEVLLREVIFGNGLQENHHIREFKWMFGSQEQAGMRTLHITFQHGNYRRLSQ